MKAAIIAIAKKENHYIKEWVDWHLCLGFDNIIICDDNEIDDERISDVISDDRVIIKDYRGRKGSVQIYCYTTEWLENRSKYDWILFIDIDEFVILEDKYNHDIHNFLNDSIFEGVDIIRLTWQVYGTNGKNDVEDDWSVMNRFTDKRELQYNRYAKSFLNTKLNYIPATNIVGHGYFANKDLIAVDATGKPCENKYSSYSYNAETGVYQNAWINHYITKTIGEYVRQKVFRGGANSNPFRYVGFGTYNTKELFKYFWTYNDYDEEQAKYGLELYKKIRKEQNV